MLLGKKSKSTLESDWAVILDRSPNEFLRTKAIEKLSETFSISEEEAKDLIENTPIILLDHLSFELAERVKDSLTQGNINCSLTKDTFAKRKCFRAVWPEPPNVNHLLGEGAGESAEEFEDSMPPSAGVVLTPKLKTSDEFTPPPAFSEPVDDEERRLRELTLDLQKENEMLRLELEKAEHSVRAQEQKKIGGEIQKLQNECFRHEETIESLRNEHRTLTAKIEELERGARGFSEAQLELEHLRLKVSEAPESAISKSELAELRSQSDHFQAACLKAQNLARLAQSEARQYQTEWAQVKKACSEGRAEVEDLKRMLTQAQADSVGLKEEQERIRLEAESRLQNYTGELEEWKRKANDWSASYFKVVKENEFLRSHQNEELESLKERNQQLQGQMEQAQKQIRDFANQLEQQEFIQKRMKATTQVADQEARLKGFVQKQQTLESEIRLREEELKTVLSEQEAVEQEIVKAKQVQKYLLEQAKLKDKTQSRFVRPRTQGSNPGFIAPPMD